MTDSDFVVFNEDLITVRAIGQGVLAVSFEADHDPIEFLIGEAQAASLAAKLTSTLMDVEIEREGGLFSPPGSNDLEPF